MVKIRDTVKLYLWVIPVCVVLLLFLLNASGGLLAISQVTAQALSTPPPKSTKQFTTLTPGATLPTNAECAARLRQTTWEPRPGNTARNKYKVVKGTDFNIPSFNGSNGGIWIGDHPQKAQALLNRLDGNFSGTTDEIIQWAACKWGVDEDLARAQAVVESNWDMDTNGDNGESFGLYQVRITAHADVFPGVQKSTAFNADYTYFRWRLCFEGLVDYLGQTNGSYTAGDALGCMGTWYTGNWYGDGGGYGGGTTAYIQAVNQKLSERIWETWSGTQVSPKPTTSPVNPSPTRVPSNPVASPTRTPTVITQGTRLNLNLLLHGIGKGGDNVNPQNIGNMSPVRSARLTTIEIYNANNQLASTKQVNVNFQATSGSFGGVVDLSGVQTGVYIIKVKVPQYLKKTIPGILNVVMGQATNAPTLALVSGDMNNDNSLSILDYNMLLDCFSDLSVARNCSDTNKKLSADLTDDGKVNQFDYNLFLRELSVQAGQ